MEFGHEKLDVYRSSLHFVAFVAERYERLDGKNRNLRDQLTRACQSVPLNIAEGNGKWGPRDSARFFQIARGSAMECAAVLDMLKIFGGLTESEVADGKELVHRVASMLSKLISHRLSTGREDTAIYNQSESERESKYESDHDYDYDHDQDRN